VHSERLKLPSDLPLLREILALAQVAPHEKALEPLQPGQQSSSLLLRIVIGVLKSLMFGQDDLLVVFWQVEGSQVEAYLLFVHLRWC